MRRLEVFTLALACLLTLTACGGGAEAPDAGRDPLPPDGGEDMTVYDCGGLSVALPTEHLDLLRVDTDFPDAEESWKPLISVYEKASYEAAMEDFGGGGGFLFGFLAMDQAAFEQHISSDGSGIEVFATDGERYYAYTYPTDVQFCRPDAESVPDHPDWPVWEKLCKLGPQVREDFLTRNNLQSFSVQDFLGRLDESGGHVVLKYYPYFLKDGDTRIYNQLLLRQPARQGEGGLWAVEQWLDARGTQYLYFPDSFERVPEVDQGYMERNQRLQQLVLDLEFRPEDVGDMDLLNCVGEATGDNWGALGRFMYGSDWFNPLMDAVAEAAVGGDQQTRNRAVMSFLLATKDARTDFRTPLDEILQTQAQADPGAFTAALAEFSEEDQARIRSNTTALK